MNEMGSEFWRFTLYQQKGHSTEGEKSNKPAMRLTINANLTSLCRLKVNCEYANAAPQKVTKEMQKETRVRFHLTKRK